MLVPRDYTDYDNKFGANIQVITKTGKLATLPDIINYLKGEKELDPMAKSLVDMVSPDEKTKQELLDYVEYLYDFEMREWGSEIIDHDNTLFDGERNVDIIVNEQPSAAWGHYLNILKNKGFENIPEMQSSAKNVMELLQPETIPGKPVKGAIIGNVQSGKTANMEAIISLAADNGWNFFVILSGVIENLRTQTENRFIKDLRRKPDADPPDKLIYDWEVLDPRMTVSQFSNAFIELGHNSQKRYIYVCLKNSPQLTRLINKLKSLDHIDKMKMLVIDDEADQASVNTKTNSRTTINSRIINLIEGKDKDSVPLPATFKSVNYLCYTATPYAILLNERIGLYPGNFIFALTPSTKYIGVDRIFGSEKYEGMHQCMVIQDPNIGNCYESLAADPTRIPETLKDCISWFICCVAILRKRSFGKPVSMLMNVDIATVNHKVIDDAVVSYLKNHRADLYERCRKVYERETKKLTVEKFKELIPDYGKLNEDDPYPDIADYPTYDKISDEVEKIINKTPTRILLDPEDKEKRAYSPENAIHVCVDNSKDDAEAIGDEIYYTNRLFYPTPGKNDDVLKETPAFIIIGGNTLSRGLTIENLVATYFQRNRIKQADALLQMGRWFGFREGYELLPRIWMDKRTCDAFAALSQINEVMMEKIRDYHKEGITPEQYAVRIPQVPEHNMLRSLTDRKKMQGAIETIASFAGLDKEFHKYHNDATKLRFNLELTRSFLEDIGDNYRGETGIHRHLYTRVDYRKTMEYLKRFERIADKFSNSTDSCIEWLDYVNPLETKGFNVIVAGLNEPINGSWSFGKYSINKVGRHRNTEVNDTEIGIKTVRDKTDMILDIPESEMHLLSETERNRLLKEGDLQLRRDIRTRAGLNTTPLLVIYVADAKFDNFPEDVVMIAIHVPNGIKSELNPDPRKYVYLEDL